MKRLAVAVALATAATALATPSGTKWFPGTGIRMGAFPIKYQVFAHTTINGMPANSFNTAVLPRLQEAFTVWTSTRLACTSWRSVCDNGAGGCTFTMPAGSAAINGQDNTNRVVWLSGTAWTYSSNTLGVTSVFSYQGTGEIFDADMQMNNNINWGNQGNINTFDYESVLVHEAGHFLGLDHTLNVTSAVMFEAIANGQVKRTLTQTDITDICGVYPAMTSGIGQGSPCTMQSQCSSGLVCRGLPAGMGKICTVDCSTNMGACATVAPLTCQTADTGMACLPPPASTDYCKHCLDGSDCSNGRCVGAGVLSWCTSPCSTTAPCPTGSICLNETNGQACAAGATCVCAPNPTMGMFRCTNQCTGSTCGMTPGFKCVTGTCEPSTTEGSRCDLHGICDACLLCAGSTMAMPPVYHCRRCCGGQGMGANCTACPNTACSAGNVCTPLGSTVDRVCIPNAGADLCQSCSGGVPCLNGNTCIGGSCHAACSPVNPGACTACVDTGLGSFVCACTGEIRDVGQTCGTNPTVQACRNGLLCASGTCRTGCNVGNPTTCMAGETCQSLGGTVGACVPAPPGTTCAACAGTNCAPDSTCHQGRCYKRCNVGVMPGPCDYSCLDVGGGVNLCACSDQIRGEGAACGPNPIAGCGDRLVCIDDGAGTGRGTCSGECNPNDVNACPVLKECRLLSGTTTRNVCQPLGGAGGGGGTGTGGGGPDPRLDCTADPALCPKDTECIPNGDGTATCRPASANCNPNATTNQCRAGLICRSVDNMVGVFKCQSPNLGNSGGCGCSSGAGLMLAVLALVWRRRR